MEWLCVLLSVLVFIVLIGHATWVFIAWILRGGRPKDDRTRFEPTLNEDRAATARYLAYLKARGLLDQETHVRLTRIMAESLHSVESYLDKRRGRPAEVQSGLDETATDAVPWQPQEAEKPGAPLHGAPPAWVELGVKDEIIPKPVVAPVVEVPAPVHAEPSPPAEPRRPFGEVLASFMAEKNIRWGELIGGLLIICCSTALVISLWTQIEAIPILKFVIFTAITAALFGAGLFVHHRWKLPTTGHAILVISSLLVPLNLLAFAAFSPKGLEISGWAIGVELPAIAVFWWLTLLAARAILPDSPKLFASGMVTISFCSLVIRFLSPFSMSQLLVPSLLPVGLYVAVTSLLLRRHSRAESIEEGDAKRLILQLGIQTFACVVPFGLLLKESGQVGEALRVLSPLLCAVACPSLLTGLVILGRLSPQASAQMRTTATSITLVAAAVALSGVGLAWPVAGRLIPAMLLNAVAAFAVSRSIRHASLHAAVATWLTLAWVLCAQLLLGAISWSAEDSRILLSVLFSAGTGQVLVVPVAACAAAAMWMHRRCGRELALGYDLPALVFAIISIALVTWFGFGLPGDPERIIWVYVLYGAAALAAAGRLKSHRVVWIGCILIYMALIQALVYAWPLKVFPWPTAVLVGSGTCTVAVVALKLLRLPGDAVRAYVSGLSSFALAASLLAVVLMLNGVESNPLTAFSLRTAWVCVLWAVLAVANLWPALFTGSQITLAAAVCTALQSHLRDLAWCKVLPSPLHDPWVWQAHLLVIGGLCLIWCVARLAVTQWTAAPAPGSNAIIALDWRTVARKLLQPSFPPTDHWMVVFLFLSVVLLAGWSVSPGVATEHGARPLPLGVYSHAAGGGSWALLAMIAAVLLLQTWEGCRGWAFLGLMGMATCGLLLIAARFEAGHHVVDAWRWLSAGAFLVASAAFWTRGYWLDRLLRLARCRTAQDPGDAGIVRIWLFVLFAVPVVLLTASFVSAAGINKMLVSQGLSDLHWRLSLCGPTLLVVISLFGYGCFERRPGYAVAAAGLACAAITVVEVFIHGQSRRPVSIGFVIWLLQLNVIVSAAIALAWQVVRTLAVPQGTRPDYPSLPLLLGRVIAGMLLALGVGLLLIMPRPVQTVVFAVGNAWGIAATILTECALVVACRRATPAQQGFRESLWVLLGVALPACALAPIDAGGWLCFHVSTIGFALAGGLRLWSGNRQLGSLAGTGWQETFDAASAGAGGLVRRIEHDLSCSTCGYNLRGLSPAGRCPECGSVIPPSVETAVSRLSPQWAAENTLVRLQVIGGIAACVLLSTLFALRGAGEDPQRPWWSALTMAVLSILCMATAAWAPRRMLAYAAGVEICLAVSVWWAISFWQRTATALESNLTDLVNLNVIALAAAGIAWLFTERRFVLGRSTAGYTERWPAFHQAAAVVSVVILSILTCRGLTIAAVAEPLAGMSLLFWLAWIASAAIVLACSLDPGAVYMPAGVYLLGMAGMTRLISQGGMSPYSLAWAMSAGQAVYVLVTTIAWRRWTRSGFRVTLRRATEAWLPSVNTVVAAIAVLLAIYVNVSHPGIAWRMLIVVVPLLCAVTVVMAPAGAAELSRRTCAVVLLIMAGALFSWSWVAPDAGGAVIQRAIGLTATLAVAMAACAAAIPRLSPAGSWVTAVSYCFSGSGALAGAALLYIAGFEALAWFEDRPVPLPDAGVAAMIAALVLMIVICVFLAVRERLDPLRLDSQWREAYVYAAEVLAGLLVLHVRATMPWLFSGVIEEYWPILVIGLAFIASAAGEVCERQGRRVLARPFGRTGVFLPALASLELVIDSSRVNYSVVLLIIGVLYGVLAVMRRSLVLSGLAGISLTGSLWYLLYHVPGLGLAEHPQLWFIPPTLAVLAAGHLNRARLGEQQRSTLNYGCLSVIYISSTADVFLIGVAKAPWLPLVLAGLSVIGVLVGVASRIRSFLMLGTGFLCLSLMTMIWYAAVDLGWTWLWYVAGIALGIAIIAVFALFEKKRNEMTALIEQVKKWNE